nr:Gag-Pol polyprotein [Tanacetum cinerariifolium]
MKFRNDQIAPILYYGDLVQGAVTIKRVYYVEELNHNLFSVGQFCDADLNVAFRKSTCYIRDLKGNDILTGSRGTDLYSITLQDTTSPNPIFLMAKAMILWLVFQSKNSSKIIFVLLVSWGKQNESLFKQRLPQAPKDGYNFYTWTYVVPCLSKEDFMLKDGENLDKMKEKGDACIFVGYSTQSRAYREFNKRTRVILETIHVNFDELPQMASDHVSFDPVLECQRTALEHDILSPGPQCQDNVTHAAEIVTTSNELDFLFSLMVVESLNGSTQVVSKSSTVITDDAPNQQHVIGNPSQSVRTRRQLESDGEMCMFALT